MYEAHVLNHYSDPYHKGPLPDGPEEVHRGRDVSTVCGDEVTIEARINGGVITEIWWQGDGCCFSQAAASMLVKCAEQTSVAHMLKFSDSDLFELFQAEYPDARRGCILVSLKALRKLLESHQ